MGKIFGDYIKRLRMRNNYSLYDVEKYCGVSNAYMSQIETGKRNPPGLAIMRLLSNTYNIPIEQIVNAAIADMDNINNVSTTNEPQLEQTEIPIEDEAESKEICVMKQILAEIAVLKSYVKEINSKMENGRNE